MRGLGQQALRICILMVWAPIAAFSGTNSSGGGNQIKTEFRLRANNLISRIATVPAANELCPIPMMREGLKAEIRVVDQLIDPSTNQPPTEPNLEAWTSKEDIQLLRDPWQLKLLQPVNPLFVPSIETLILHEVYRATKSLLPATQADLCDDDRYQISEKIPALLRGPTQQSQVFRFEAFSIFMGMRGDGFKLYNVQKGEWYEFPSLTCDQNPESEEPGGSASGTEDGGKLMLLPSRTCMGLELNSGKLVLFRGALTGTRSQTKQKIFIFVDASILIESPQLSPSSRVTIENFMRFTSTSRPFHLVYHTEEGTLAYGPNLYKLQVIPFTP